MIPVLLTLRILHVLAAAGLVGAIIFNYFLVRPMLRKIPPAQAVVVAQGVGTRFTILGLTALSVLVVSGALRLYFQGLLDDALTISFYTTRYGRWLGMMVLGWLVTMVSSAVMTSILRPRLMRKLSPTANPTLSDVEKRRAMQLVASGWLDRLQLINLGGSLWALLSGASLGLGGFF